VLNAAKAKGYRQGENPAASRDHLENLLPKPDRPRGHYAAMPYDEVPEFLGRLRQHETVAALALEFAILTAARTSEVLGACWPEINLGPPSGIGQGTRPISRASCRARLAHAIGDQAEQAYRRSDALERRRALMDAWARHCGTVAGGVLQLRRAQ
jgi:hypothetical protein